MGNEFVHLHGHTTYSLGDATTLIKSDKDNNVIGLPERVAKLGMKACAITDHGTMAGVVEFWKECKKWDVKPIFGMEAYIAFQSAKVPYNIDNPTGHIILLARNYVGYTNLCKLLRTACTEEHFSRHPRIDLDLLAEHAEGLIGLTACVGGLPQKCMIGWHYYDRSKKVRLTIDPKPDQLVPLVGRMNDIFGQGNFFLEVQNHKMDPRQYQKLNPEQQADYDWLAKAQYEVVLGSWEASRKTGVPLVVTNDFHYLTHEMMDTRRAVLAIGGRGAMDRKFDGHMASQRLLMANKDRKGVHEVTGQMYVKSPAEMAELSHDKDYPFLMQNTMVIAEMCEDIDLSPPKDEKGRVIWNLPPVELQEGETAISKLRKEVMDGFDARYPGDSKHPWRTPQCRMDAIKQIHYELSVMEKLGLESYHLMVADYVRFAHSRGILVGPGRGSGAGSVVVYCLGITDLDPLRHGLLFERYLNPDRASAADLDIDFDPTRVEEIHRYCIEKYGEENVAKISTYGSLHAKGTIRRLGRAMCLDEAWSDDISKQLDDEAGEGRTRLADVITDRKSRASGVIKKFLAAGGPMAQEYMDVAVKLDDIKVSRGQHAAGIVVSGTPLDGVIPLVFHDRKDEKSIATEIPYDHLEDLGLLKQDLLVVDGLTIIDQTLKSIRARHDPNYELPLEVDETYANDVAIKTFRQGELAGVWQMSSSGMRELCVTLMPENLDEIAAVCALYRPGPLDYQDPETRLNMVEMFVRRKHGMLPVTYDHPKLESILKETYGVIVFQEQIMHIARAMCGWTYTQADYLRKAVAKKKGIAEQKELFIPDCLKHTPDFGEFMTHQLWDMIETFGKYGFNKSHSAAYGKLSYQMSLLKGEYPLEFLAAAITVACTKGDKAKRVGLLHDFVAEAAHRGIKVLQPDIKESQAATVPEGSNSIRLGFGAIRGVSGGALKLETIEEIIYAEPEEIRQITEAADEIRDGIEVVSEWIKKNKKTASAGQMAGAKTKKKELSGLLRDLGVIPEELRYGLDNLTSAIRTIFATGVNRTVLKGLANAGALDRYGDRAFVLATVDKMSTMRAKKGKARMAVFFGLTDDDALDVEEEPPEVTYDELREQAEECLYLTLSNIETPPPKSFWGHIPHTEVKKFSDRVSRLPRGATELIVSVSDDKMSALFSYGSFDIEALRKLIANHKGTVVGAT